MGEITGITWADSTLNWWWVCSKVTDACDNCYAEEWAARIKGASWGDAAPRLKIKSAPALLRKIDKRGRSEGTMKKVFAHSMSDIFDVLAPDEWREEEFAAWEKTTNIWFLALTKRPAMPKKYNYPHEKVWLGTSLGSDKDLIMAEKIVECPACLHWVSYEPAIGHLSIQKLPDPIKWVVIGGESGNNARPFHMEWAYDAIAACRERGITVFMKQLGAKPFFDGKPYPISDTHGKILGEWPEDLRIQEFPDVSRP